MKPKIIPRPLPDTPDDSDAIMEHVINLVTGNDGYWPHRVESAFSKAGLAIRWVEREEAHPSVWTVWLTRGSLDLPKDNKVASKQIRRALAKCGLRIRPGEMTVLEQRGDKLKCVFLFGSAAPPVDL